MKLSKNKTLNKSKKKEKTISKEYNWIDIKGYEGLYQICIEGHIRSLDRKVLMTSKDQSREDWYRTIQGTEFLEVTRFENEFDEMDGMFTLYKGGKPRLMYLSKTLSYTLDNKDNRKIIDGEFNFGKYKGKHLEDVSSLDRKYFDWCSENIKEFNQDVENCKLGHLLPESFYDERTFEEMIQHLKVDNIELYNKLIKEHNQ